MTEAVNDRRDRWIAALKGNLEETLMQIVCELATLHSGERNAQVRAYASLLFGPRTPLHVAPAAAAIARRGLLLRVDATAGDVRVAAIEKRRRELESQLAEASDSQTQDRLRRFEEQEARVQQKKAQLDALTRCLGAVDEFRKENADDTGRV